MRGVADFRSPHESGDSEPLELVRKFRCHAFAWSLMFVGFLWVKPAQAQPRVYELNGSPSCAACKLERYKIATVRDTDAGVIGEGAQVFVNSDKSFFLLTGSAVWDELYFANEQGRIVRRVGRTGEGPGEFRMPSDVMENDKSYLVLDPRLGRITTLSKRDLEVLNTIKLPPIRPLAARALSGGRYVFSGVAATRAAAGNTLHFVSDDGKTVTSFRPAAMNQSNEGEVSLIAVSGDTAIWVGTSNQYRLEKWNLNGTLSKVYERHVPWFPPFQPGMRPTPGQTFAYMSGIYEDVNGRLWIQVGQRTAASTGSEQTLGSSAGTYIEVLDTHKNVLIASTRFAVRANIAMGSGFYHQVRGESQTGDPLLEVWGTRLQVPK
jgi:hypothetical protein